MKVDDSIDDAVLLKIKRQFSKEESVAVLLKKIAEVDFNNGVLKSEIAELKDNITILEEEKLQLIQLNSKQKDELASRPIPKPISKLERKELQKEELVNSYMKNEISLIKKVNKLQKEVIDWRNKYFSEVAKANKENKITH